VKEQMSNVGSEIQGGEGRGGVDATSSRFSALIDQ